jgi:bifunctional non-homologous end joining protein LigD
VKLRANGRSIEITHPDKVLFPDASVTKGDLAEYYRSVAPRLLPHLRGRPLALERFPDGSGGHGFMQKHVPAHAPGWVHHARVDRVEGDPIDMIVCDNAATLVYLANTAATTLHPWLSTTRHLHRPDRLIFDLDPDGSDFGTVRLAATALRDLLEEAGLRSFPMTTGSRGLHVHVPITPREDFDEVRAFALDVARMLCDRYPDRLTTEVRKASRHGRLFVDTLRNAYGQHAVAPYSVRPLPDAPVATPLEWSEVDDPGLHSRRYTLPDIPGRDDPWHGMHRAGRSLATARAKLAVPAAA